MGMILKYGVYIYTPKALGLKKVGQTVIAQRIRALKFEETITNTKSLSNIYYSNVTMHDVYKFKLCNLLTNGHGLWLASSRDIKDRNIL